MYAADRVNIYNAGAKHYADGAALLSVVCDYSVLFCATSSLYESIFVMTSLANRVCSCLCLILLASIAGDVTPLDALDTATMREVLATEEILHDEYDKQHALLFSSTPHGDIAERNRYRSRDSKCSVRMRTRYSPQQHQW
jgi:hypothetical protein